MSDDELAQCLREAIEFCRVKLANKWIREDRGDTKPGFEKGACYGAGMFGAVASEARAGEPEAVEEPPYWLRD